MSEGTKQTARQAKFPPTTPLENRTVTRNRALLPFDSLQPFISFITRHITALRKGVKPMSKTSESLQTQVERRETLKRKAQTMCRAIYA